jgi:predicted transcriptional regulator
MTIAARLTPNDTIVPMRAYYGGRSVLPVVILSGVTKKTAISLPDDLYRDIERARKRAGKDRSTWIQEAAGEYLKKRTKEEEIEAWLSAEERFPPTEDEKSFYRWQEKNWDKLFTSPPARLPKARRR